MLTIELNAEDLGRIRFAEAPAPVLETSLMLLELRQRPHRVRHRSLIDDPEHDWREPARATFSSAAQPLLPLAPTARYVYFLEPLTAEPHEAFQRVHDSPPEVQQANAERAHRMNLGPVPAWMRRYDEGDPVARTEVTRALRAFHAACLAPRWPQVTAGFHHDVLARTSLVRRHGVAAMLNTLSPHLHLNGMVLEGRYPWERHIRPNGQGLTLMPSAFWTAYPMVTWYDDDQSQYVLIYPALPAPGRHAYGCETRANPPASRPLGALLGQTRATVLHTLDRPMSTSALARRVGISPAAASTHTATLRAAGLVSSERHGQSVVHQLTELGWALLWQY